MATTILSTKGQLIIPKEMRERHGWRAGTVLEIEERGGSIVIRPAADPPRTRPEDVIGFLRWDGPPRSLQEMDAAVAKEASRRR